MHDYIAGESCGKSMEWLQHLVLAVVSFCLEMMGDVKCLKTLTEKLFTLNRAHSSTAAIILNLHQRIPSGSDALRI